MGRYSGYLSMYTATSAVNYRRYGPDFEPYRRNGVKKYENFGPNGRIQNIYLGLDLDLRKIIPGDSTFMRFLKEFINTFKIIPTPVIKWNTTNGKLTFAVH